MDKKEHIMAVLEKMGYAPEKDNDGDIMFRYQMKAIYLMTENDDTPYVAMMIPQYSKIEEGKETQVLAVCNKINRDFRLVKVYVDGTLENVTASCEFYYTNDEALEQNIEKSIEILGVMRRIYRKFMSELSED
ncbi:MAG: YbjN domain-containing protein [Bacteroidaceae bacterium]|nr:YbjN domain-containing protein [Bacteroidaceae bacterium]MBR1467926.1 YbjN domain-containing protein [Bacteroidaceae bacterium]